MVWYKDAKTALVASRSCLSKSIASNALLGHYLCPMWPHVA